LKNLRPTAWLAGRVRHLAEFIHFFKGKASEDPRRAAEEDNEIRITTKVAALIIASNLTIIATLAIALSITTMLYSTVNQRIGSHPFSSENLYISLSQLSLLNDHNLLSIFAKLVWPIFLEELRAFSNPIRVFTCIHVEEMLA